jgi:hypothetical protein
MRTINIGLWQCGHIALSTYWSACGVCVATGICPSLLPSATGIHWALGAVSPTLTAPASYHEVAQQLT